MAGEPEAELGMAVADSEALQQCALATDRIMSQREQQNVYPQQASKRQNASGGIPALQQDRSAALIGQMETQSTHVNRSAADAGCSTEREWRAGADHVAAHVRPSSHGWRAGPAGGADAAAE